MIVPGGGGGFFYISLIEMLSLLFVGLQFDRAYFLGSIICTVIFWVPEVLHYCFGSPIWVKVRKLSKASYKI